jgi:hypothetical protein
VITHRKKRVEIIVIDGRKEEAMRNIHLDSLAEYDKFLDPPADWLAPELRPAMRGAPPDGDLGLRRLLEFPEIVRPIFGRAGRQQRRLGRASLDDAIEPDPDWPDAA